MKRGRSVIVVSGPVVLISLVGCSGSASPVDSASSSQNSSPSSSSSPSPSPVPSESTAPSQSAPGSDGGNERVSGGLRLITRNNTKSVWRCFDYVDEWDSRQQKFVKVRHFLFYLQPGGDGSHDGEGSGFRFECEVYGGNLVGLGLWMTAANPWLLKPSVDTDLVDMSRDVPTGTCFNTSKCSIWHTDDKFAKEGSRVVHRYPARGFEMVLRRGRKYSSSKNIEMYVDLNGN